MDLETIQKINRDALKAAKDAQDGGEDYMDKKHIYMYLAAAVGGVLSYYLFQRYEFRYAMVEKDGKKVFDQTRGVIFAVVVALLVLLAAQMYYK